MDLHVMRIAENRRKLQTTVLHRPGGKWHGTEVSRLVNGLITEVSEHHKHPEYLIIFGHYTKEQTLKAIGGGVAYTAQQMTGMEKLPFSPGFV